VILFLTKKLHHSVIFRQHLMGEIECIEADVVLQLARTESMQALSTGNWKYKDNVRLVRLVKDFFPAKFVLIWSGEEEKCLNFSCRTHRKICQATQHKRKLWTQKKTYKWRKFVCTAKKSNRAHTSSKLTCSFTDKNLIIKDWCAAFSDNKIHLAYFFPFYIFKMIFI